MESSIETTIKVESKETIPTKETVRAAIFHNGKFLLLKKSIDSKNPGGLEFPGGKIDETKGSVSSPEEQEQTIVKEIQEETGISVDKNILKKVKDFKNYFEVVGKDGVTKKNKRLIHLFFVNIPDEQKISLKINETKNEKGESEDKHKSFEWVSPDELIKLATSLKENLDTGEQAYLLSRNSRAIKELLKEIGFIKENSTTLEEKIFVGQENK